MLTKRKNISLLENLNKFLIMTFLALITLTSNTLAGTISGKVTDNSGIGVEGIDVTVGVFDEGHQDKTQTDAEGKYILQNLPENYYLLLFNGDSQGYLSEYYHNTELDSWSARFIRLSENGTKIADVKLDKKPVLRGTVKDTSGQALKDVTVEVFPTNDRTQSQSTLTNADGEYAFEKGKSLSVLQGMRRLKFKTKNKGYEYYKDAITFDVAEDIMISINEERTIDVVLGDLPSGSISGKVTDNAGIPLKGVNVAALYKDGNDRNDSASNIQTNAEGNYEFKNLPANNYKISFSAFSQGYPGEYFDNKWSSATVIRLSQNGNEIANAKLDKWPVLGGTVKNPSGQLLKNINVVVYYGLEKPDGSIYWDPHSRTKTNNNGEYAFEKENSIVLKHMGQSEQHEFKMRLKFSSDSKNYQFYKDAATLDEAEDLVMKIDEEYTIDMTLNAENKELAKSGSLQQWELVLLLLLLLLFLSVKSNFRTIKNFYKSSY